jgi:16S rRNA (uracil1498-N3)-methyltransferase
VRLTRIYVDAVLTAGSIVELPAVTASHLAKVLRARSGDELILFSGDGREYSGEVESVRGSKVSAAVGRSREVDRESPLSITLVQCVPRGDRMDFIVQKATELGVARIVPVLSQRSVVRLDAAQADSKAAHWRAVVINACEQCGRNRLPLVEAPRPLEQYLATAPPAAPAGGARLLLEPESDIGVGAALAPGTAAPGAALAPGAAAPGAPASGAAAPRAIEIAIGPEGGFAAEELEMFRLCGFAAMRFGPRVLRTETAAIAAITALQSRFGDLQ